MGLTPVEGLIMGTRCGDLDQGVLTYLMMKEELDISSANTLINKHSGMLGITGVSSDMREIMKAAEQNNERAILGLSMYHYRIKKYIGSYAAAMGGLDLVVFTGGIGENSDYTRAEVSKDMEFLGLDFDFDKNKGIHGEEQVLSKNSSKIKVLVVPTNEELIIAKDTLNILDEMRYQGGYKTMNY
jgi:acetate kinase